MHAQCTAVYVMLASNRSRAWSGCDDSVSQVFFQKLLKTISDDRGFENKVAAADLLAAAYETTVQCVPGKKCSQSGTMRLVPFLQMITRMQSSGVTSGVGDFIDCGCGAGVVLFF